MKQTALFISMMLSVSAFAGYTYTITDGMDFGGLTLTGTQTLLMTGGGGDSLGLSYWSSAVIRGTAPYDQNIYPSGGIEDIGVGDYAHLEFSGGEVYRLGVGSYGRAVLSGGKINQIVSGQTVTKYDYSFDPPKLVPDPHITVICNTWNYNSATSRLTGTWKDGTAFNIFLKNSQGWPSVFDNMLIIPEPLTLALLALGGLLIRKK